MVDEALTFKTGVTSKILWHFTGGPRWNEKLRKQNIKLKPARDAYNALYKILQTKELRLGSYREIIRSRVNIYHLKDQKAFTPRATPIEIESSPVCCVSDIPIKHLDYHSIRYGKFAIGFYRKSLIKNNFNPVFYTLESRPIIGEIISVLKKSQSIHSNIKLIYYNFYNELNDIISIGNKEVNNFINLSKNDYKKPSSIFERQITHIQNSLSSYLSFVKTVEETELQTIYSEREWRSIQTFKFKYDDVAMVILPKKVGNTNYYDQFLEKAIKKLNIPRKIPIVSWDDLIEH